MLSVTASFVQKATGSLQLCAGQEAGIEAAIHAIRLLSDSDDNEAVLLVDAKNAFNCLKRRIGCHQRHHSLSIDESDTDEFLPSIL